MIVINNGTVLTVNEADEVIFGGHVVISGDRIAAVGPGEHLAGPDDTVIDAGGKIVMPGLVDLHYHTAIAKGFSDHLPLWEYLDTCWYPFIRTLDADAAYWSAAASYLESVKCGVTTVNDMYRRLPDLARAARDIGIRAVLSSDVALPEHNLDPLQDNKDAYDAGLLGPDCVAAHCVHLNDTEIALMRETGTHISHNPGSNAKLGNDIARLPELLAAGINVGLGHDAAECNNSRDPFETMKFASLIHRAARVDASLVQAP